MKYLDPKADLTFKKVFGEHPDLVISLLNALLPFETEDEKIVSVEYLPAELFPETPLKKNSIVDVRCRDVAGRIFIVEMQMIWSPAFMSRVLFNASKAYVRQLGSGNDYNLLQPVYSLNLVNDVYMPEVEGYYHDYRIVHMEHSEKVIEGLRFVFVELPKFKPQTFSEKKMHVLWLRYLTEIGETTYNVPQDLMSVPEIKKAVGQLEQGAFNEAQLQGYDDFWDAVRVERTLMTDALREGHARGHEMGLAEGRAEGLKEGRAEGLEEGRAEGLEEGRAKGLEEGRAEGRTEERLEIARNLKKSGVPVAIIAQTTGLGEDEINAL